MADFSGKHPMTRVAGSYRVLCLVAVVGLLASIDGCTRAFFRKATDLEVNDILAEKDKYAAWKIEQYHVYPDPRSRFADPTNPDRPPMPADDEAAYKLSPHPQTPGVAGVGKVRGTGYLELLKAWDATNREERKNAPDAQPPGTGPATVAADGAAGKTFPAPGAGAKSNPVQELFNGPLTADQGFLLTLDQSVELGLINSREYQSFREDLYLAALPVTLQRFSFAYQFAATEQAVRQWAGPLSSVGKANNWSLGSNVGVSKLFSTGALLTAAFANNTVFNFLGAAPNLISASTLNVNFVQPFLQGGGKAVTLEPLTEAERNLFYQVRYYARFREQFYLSIALGTTLPGSLPSASGVNGTLGGTSPISILATLGFASTDVAGLFRGYLPTLFRELDMALDKKYVADLERAARLFEGFQEGGLLSPLQVVQVKSTLLNSKNNVLKDIQDATNALDQFKLQLGVPVNLPLILDDAPGRPITRQFDRYYNVLYEADQAAKLVEQQDQLTPAALRAFLLKLYTESPLVRGTQFQERLPPAWAKWDRSRRTDQQVEAELKRLKQVRTRLMDLKTEREDQDAGWSPADEAALRDAELDFDLGGLEQTLRRYESKPWEKQKDALSRQTRNKLFRLVSYAAQIVLVWARNDRFDRVSQLWPELPATPLPDCGEGPPLDLLKADSDTAQEAAVQAALTNRVDLMNARAQVVDSWRQLRVTANALLGVFNVQYHMDTNTPPTGSNPLAFASSRTNQELILTGQLPLVRISQRNIYRTAIINYQRARRSLMALEDNIAAQVRFDVRQLHLFAENYKIQQKVVELFYIQIENALEIIVAPTDPVSLQQTGTAGQAAAAALTQQYLGALGGLNGAQTKMYDLWLSLQATRMELYLDLERLPLDQRGVWTDESGNAGLNQSPGTGERGPAQPGNPIGGVGGASFGQPIPAGQRGPAPAGPVPRFLAPAAATPLE